MSTTPPMISVIIPMYNEAARIARTVTDACSTLHAWRVRAEVLLVDDGSTDATPSIAAGLCGSVTEGVEVLLLRHGRNMGKGAAVRTGMKASRGAWVLFMDADNSTRLAELEKLNAEARRTSAPIVIGSRACAGAEVASHVLRRVSGRAFHACLSVLGLNLARDTQCGFKLYRADAAAFIAAHSTENGFAFDVEHLLLARVAGIPVREVGVRWTHHTGGSIRVVRDGFAMLRDSWRIRRRVRGTRLALPAAKAPAPPLAEGPLIEVKPLPALAISQDTHAGARAG